MKELLKLFLAHPLTRGLDIDDPCTTSLRRRIIREKCFLRRVYEEWYTAIVAELPAGEGRVLEIGSGPGFMQDYIPGLITSDVFRCPGIGMVLDGHSLPFEDGSLRAIVMTEVLHHLPQPRRFFAESARCVRPGGVVVMIEPWVTPWSRVMWGRRFHHEPFLPEAKEWEFPSKGPLSGANGAMPWIVFERDRKLFAREFPMFTIRKLRPFMPFRYVLAGGVAYRSLMPGWSFCLWRGVERMLSPWMQYLAMYAEIVLLKEKC